jgi:WD40 repeat protein
LIRRNALPRGDAVTRRTLLTGAAAGAVVAAGGNAFAKQAGDCDRLRSVLIGHRSIVSSAAFSPDARQIVTASYDNTARLWNAATGVGLDVLNGHTDVVFRPPSAPTGGAS